MSVPPPTPGPTVSEAHGPTSPDSPLVLGTMGWGRGGGEAADARAAGALRAGLDAGITLDFPKMYETGSDIVENITSWIP